MGQVNELRKRSNAFVRDLPRTIERIVNFNEDLEELNKKQLQASKLATDQDIPGAYSPAYAAWKSRFFPQSFGDGKINLFLTGNLFDHLEIKAKGKKFEILSLVPYAVNLIRKYTNQIFGIAPSNRQTAKGITTRMLSEQYKRRVL